MAGKEISLLDRKGGERLIDRRNQPPGACKGITLFNELQSFRFKIAEICTWLEMVHIVGSTVTT